MKIVFAIKTLEHSVGGAERITSCLANAFHDKGHQVTLLSFDTLNSAGFYPLNKGINRAYVPACDTSKKTSILEIPKLLYGLRKTITDLKPDVVVAVMHSMFVPLQLSLLGTGIRVIFSEHTVPKYYKNKPIEFAALVTVGLLADRITVASDSIKCLYPRVLQRAMAIIPNPVFSSSIRADVLAPDSKKTILSVGRLDPLKDHAILIDAFAQLAHKHPDWDLKIIGEGPERKKLEARIKSYNLQDRVFLPGTAKDIGSFYGQAQLFVMPSRYESFGLATAEAMTHALPIIGFFDCSGTNDLISHGNNGTLVPNRNADSLSQALSTLMSDANLRQKYSDSSYEIAKKFDSLHIMNKWEELIKASS